VGYTPSHRPGGRTQGAALPPRRGLRRSFRLFLFCTVKLGPRSSPHKGLLPTCMAGCPCFGGTGEVSPAVTPHREKKENKKKKGRLYPFPCRPCAGCLCFVSQLTGSSSLASEPILLSQHRHICCQTLKPTSASTSGGRSKHLCEPPACCPQTCQLVPGARRQNTSLPKSPKRKRKSFSGKRNHDSTKTRSPHHFLQSLPKAPGV